MSDVDRLRVATGGDGTSIGEIYRHPYLSEAAPLRVAEEVCRVDGIHAAAPKENARLKRLVPDPALEKGMMQDVVSRESFED
jgi:hypothetical protein